VSGTSASKCVTSECIPLKITYTGVFQDQRKKVGAIV